MAGVSPDDSWGTTTERGSEKAGPKGKQGVEKGE